MGAAEPSFKISFLLQLGSSLAAKTGRKRLHLLATQKLSRENICAF
jgi:hypothetical protein